MKGKVKWFNESKGYGFITGDDGTDRFAHFSAIEGSDKRKNLKEGQEVEFESVAGEKGPQAKNIKVIRDAKDIE